MKYINSEYHTWTESESGDNYKIFRREMEANTTVCIRFEALIEGVKPENAYKVVQDIRVRKYWDHRMEHYEVIEETEDTITQYNRLMKVNIPLFAQRDQVIKQHLKSDFPEKGSYVSIAYGT